MKQVFYNYEVNVGDWIKRVYPDRTFLYRICEFDGDGLITAKYKDGSIGRAYNLQVGHNYLLTDEEVSLALLEL